jgi:hypothetical protein
LKKWVYRRLPKRLETHGLEVVLAALGLDRGPHVAAGAAHELDRAELLDDVGALERVVEVAAAPVDARHARAHQELVAHDLEPEVVDLFALGEEAVPAEVEAVALGVDHGLGEAADLLVASSTITRRPALASR